ncbi:MAG: phosphatidate cytidylyltransferase [Lachnospiraceae bacterium]|nr:phosphatidate cytidylyltransferase [Lachnospiraceae bacterium]
MFWTRLLSSIILLASIIVLGVAGGLPLLLGVAVISIVGLFELYRVLDMHRSGLAVLCYILAAIYEAMIYTSGLTLIGAYVFLSMLALLVLYVFTYPKYRAVQIMGAYFGLIYVVFMLSFVFLVRVMPGGQHLIWLIFISAWGSDTLAYCTGMLFGRHKMAPVLSPKKSVEGAIGGILGAALLGVIYALIFGNELAVFAQPVLSVGILCGAGGAISMIGDLAASAIKRNYEIKDYGDLIPGHGGVLDRFDSIIITAPLVFFLVMFLQIVVR